MKRGDRWHFDTAAGRDEMLARRVGQNELAAIDVLRAITDAQIEYASEDRNGNGTLEYAQRFASSQGKRDGLYWPVKAGEPPSPLGALVASAADDGYEKERSDARSTAITSGRCEGRDPTRRRAQWITSSAGVRSAASPSSRGPRSTATRAS